MIDALVDKGLEPTLPDGGQKLGYHMQQSAKAAMLAEVHPLQVVKQGTGLLRHVKGGFEPFYVHAIRPRLLKGETVYVPIVGRNASSKRAIASELLFLAGADPYLQAELDEYKLTLERVFVPFCSAATLARLAGDIPDNERHGSYTNKSYRKASIWHSRFMLGEDNNFVMLDEDCISGGAKVVVGEISGYGIRFSPDRTRLEGSDRAWSTMDRLSGPSYREKTKIIAMEGNPELQDKIIKRRDALQKAQTAQEVRDMLYKSNTKIHVSGQPVDFSKMDDESILNYRNKLLKNQSSAEGAARANLQTDQIKREVFRASTEREFLIGLLTGMGWQYSRIPALSDFVLLQNPVVGEEDEEQEFEVHEDLLDACDPMIKLIRKLERFQELEKRLRGQEENTL